MFKGFWKFGFVLVAAVVFAVGCGKGENPLAPSTQGDFSQTEKTMGSPAAKVAPGVPVTVQVRVLRGGRPFAHITGFQFEMGRSVSGQVPVFAYQCRTDGTSGIGKMEINNYGDLRFPSAGGYYVAHVIDPVSKAILGQQGSIPVASNTMYIECLFNEKGEFIMIRPYVPEVPVSIIKNTATADATPSSPSGVLGSKDVHIASFIVRSNRPILAIGLGDDLGDKTIPLYTVFQTLKVRVDGSQVGMSPPVGDMLLPEVGESREYYFTLNTPLPPGQHLIDVFADVHIDVPALALTAVNTDVNGIVVPRVVTDENFNSSYIATQPMQRVYIAKSGSLSVRSVAASSQVPAKIVLAGFSDVELFKFKLVAGFEDVDASRFIISYQAVAEAYGASIDNGKPFTSLYNFKLYDGSTLVSGPKSLTSVGNLLRGQGYLDFNLGTANAFRIPAGTEKTFALTAMVNDWQSISSGSTHRFSLRADPYLDGDTRVKAITARGVVTSLSLDGPEVGIQIVGNEITVRSAYPLVERLIISTRLSVGSTSQKQLVNFKVTAIGQGGRTIELKKLTFNIAVTDATPSVPLELSNFKLYRNGTLMGQNEYYIVPRDGRMMVVFAPPGQIGGGGERITVGSGNTYELKADVANAHAGSSTDSDNITVTLLGEFGLTHPFSGNLASTPDGVVGVGPYDYNFIWSDGSTWTNGYQVPISADSRSFLPLDSWHLSK